MEQIEKQTLKTNFSLSPEGKKAVLLELSRYETKESAIIPSLFIAQKENKGWVSEAVINELARVMEIPVARINEVFKFYTMFNQKPVGKYHVQICTNISCSLEGSREMAAHICRELDVKPGEVSEDGRFTISFVECLGSCGTAPMMQVNEDYHENLTPESAMNLLREMK